MNICLFPWQDIWSTLKVGLVVLTQTEHELSGEEDQEFKFNSRAATIYQHCLQKSIMKIVATIPMVESLQYLLRVARVLQCLCQVVDTNMPASHTAAICSLTKMPRFNFASKPFSI